MKFTVLGAAGQLGRDLCPLLPGEVVPLTRQHIDLASPATIRPTLEAHSPDVVVNCAAYNFVDRAESEPEAAFAVNALGVRELARVCRDLDALLVHFSSDHVFGLDRERQTPLAESDLPGPVNVYGASKLAGEYLIRLTGPRHLIVRTCGLYGRHGSGGKGGNFVETMLKLGSQGKLRGVVADQVCTPTATTDLAQATVRLLEREATGLFHITNAGACSWWEFACAIFELSGLDVEVKRLTSAEFGAAAARPSYSVLALARWQALGLPALRPWREALADYLQGRRK